MAGIKIKKDGSIVANGVTYKDKAAYKARTKVKKTGNIFEGRRAKEKRAAKASVAQGKRNQAATSKMYAAESMFTSAKNRDVAKTTPGKARSFKDAFDAANKADKDKMKTRTGEAGSMTRPTGPTKTKRTLGSLLKKIGSKLKKKK
jgi:hypothetical protein